MDRTEGVMINGASVAEQTDRAKRRSPEAPDSENETSSAGSLEQAERGWSVAGRALLNFALIVTLAAILVANMPNSTLKSRLIVPAQSYLAAIGLGQSWGVFAPNPRQDVIYVTGHIQYSDGTTSVWSFPARTGIMAYSDYRWQKFGEHVRLDTNQQLWPTFAAYLAHHESQRGDKPVQCHSCDVGQSCSRRVRHRGLVRGGSSSSTPRRWVRNEWAARAARIRMEPVLVCAAGNVDAGIVPDRVRSARNLLDVIPPAQPFCLLRA